MEQTRTATALEDDTLLILPTLLRVEEQMTRALNGSGCGVFFGNKICTFPQLIEKIYEEFTDLDKFGLLLI